MSRADVRVRALSDSDLETFRARADADLDRWRDDFRDARAAFLPLSEPPPLPPLPSEFFQFFGTEGRCL